MGKVDVSLRTLNNRKLTLIMDIPSPYRLHFFRSLSVKLKEKRIELRVLFMAKSVPIRYWKFHESDFSFNYNFCPGLHFHIKQHSFHLNPGIVWEVLCRPSDWLVLGGGWNIPTTALCILVSNKLHRRTSLVLWAEANFRSSISSISLVKWFRNCVIKNVDAYACPGYVARTTISDYWSAPNKPFVSLPNLVDEIFFKEKVQSLRPRREGLRSHFGLRDDHLVLIWPARLHEPTKGILTFIRMIKDLIPLNVRILIAGDGPDRMIINKYIEESGLSVNIILLGHKTQEEMVKLYTISDVFLLPSLKDPNPLSVIEALWAGLPVFISIGCGNYPEAVKELENGWLVNHDDPGVLRGAFSHMTCQTKEERVAFGARSEKLAEEKFSTDCCIENFVNEIICIN